jgi:hypothetical protein
MTHKLWAQADWHKTGFYDYQCLARPRNVSILYAWLLMYGPFRRRKFKVAEQRQIGLAIFELRGKLCSAGPVAGLHQSRGSAEPAGLVGRPYNNAISA